MLCALLLSAGCSGKQGSDQQQITEQSIWQLTNSDGEVCGYLPEEDKDVSALIQLIQTHVSCVDNRSADDVMYDEESTTYTKSFAEYLEANQYQENLEKMYQENSLAITSVVIYWNPSTFSEDRLSCKVDIDSVFKFKTGASDFLSSIGVSLDKNYIEHRIYYCTQEKGEWKIANIEKSALSSQ